MTSFIPTFVQTREALGRLPKRPKKASRVIVPKGAERRYRTRLFNIFRNTRRIILIQLVPEIERMVALSQLRPDADREDIADVSALIRTIMGNVRATVDAGPLRQAERWAREFATEVSDKSRDQLLRQLKSVLEVDAFPVEPQLVDMLNSAVQENAELITSINEEYLRDVGNLVRRNVRSGARASEIVKEISGRFGLAKKRAALVARDQTNKLNGALTRMRQTNLGIEEYIWRTSRDERVRSSHAELEGRRFSWNNPPSVGHPGTPINCRCTGEPVIPGITE